MEVKTVVRCYFKTFGDFVTIYSTDVSKEGILVKSDTPLQAGDPVRLEFKLRNDYPLIMGEGQVMRVDANGASIKFVQLDADSEKFLNEVVKVKAAELKPVPGAPAVTYDAEVVQEESAEESFELDDAFSGMQDNITDVVEEVDTDAFEDVDTASFDDGSTESAVTDGGEAPLGDDPFGEVTSDFNEPAADESAADELAASDMFAEQTEATGSQDEFEQEESSEYEDVEQTPANPKALFEDIQEAPSGESYMAAYNVPVGEATTGGSTTIFERISVLKERRALIIGAGIGLVALIAGGAAWLFMGAKGAGTDTTKLAAVNGAPAAPQTPEIKSSAPVTTTAMVAPAAPTQAAPAAVAPAVVVPAAVKAEPVAAPAPEKTAPVAVAAQPPVSSPKSGPATKIVSVEMLGDGSVAIRGDGTFKKIKHFTMSEPNRIIIDLYGVGKAFKGLSRNGAGAIARIRPGEHEGKIRFVLDLKKETGKIPVYGFSADGDGIVIRPGL